MRNAALFVALAVAAASCGPFEGASKGEIVIASDFTTAWGSHVGARTGEAGVAYAVQSVGSVRGFKLIHVAYDDAINGLEDPELASRNFTEMVDDPRVLGVVGPFKSSIARVTIPIANKAELAMVSPSNTGTCLTQAFAFCKPQPSTLRDAAKPNNYFRIAAPDSLQGPAMADFAVDVLKVTKVAVWSDSLDFGRHTADTFSKRFEARGGAVVLRQDVQPFNAKPRDMTAFFQGAKNAGAQAIYAGANTGTGGCSARAQMKGILDAFFLSADGIGDSQCIKDAADQANDRMYFTIADPVAAKDPANKSLIEAFSRAFPHEDDLGEYTFLGYDSAKILIDAIGRAIDAAGGRMPTRRQVLEAVQNTKNLKLSTGTYTFDANGDVTAPTMVFYQVKNGVWTFVKQGPVAP